MRRGLAGAWLERRSPAAALALANPDLLRRGVALHRGPALATTIDARMEYYGKTLAEALDLCASSGPRQLIASSPALGDGLDRLSELAGMRANLLAAPRLGPAEWCAYFELSAAAPRRAAPPSAASVSRASASAR